MKPIPPGAAHALACTVTEADTAAHLGNPGVAVLASAICLLWAEGAARRAIGPYLDPGEGMAGYRFRFDHLAPALPGTQVQVTATVTAVRRRFVTFRFALTAGEQTLAEGEMIQSVVDLGRLGTQAT